jgi:peptide/nickel transport system ATP-binding protein
VSPAIEVRDLRVSFPTPLGDLRAVRGVSLDVGHDEVLGIVGESGSGKSVTFLAAMGLLPRSARVEGSIRIDGAEMVGADPRAWRTVRGKKIAMIFQDPLSALNPVVKVGAQIVEMLRAHQDLTRAMAWKRAVELLDLVGIPQPDQRASQYPHEFSGGMRQRAVIAMAIANNPRVLIADEPTTALDVTVQAQILDVIDRVRKEFGIAVVLITHDLGVVARMCSRVQVMYAGRTVERGPIEDLFDAPSHPYTRGLLASLPRVGLDRLPPIAGFPPNMLAVPAGCAFHPRCSHAADVCRGGVPELASVGGLETACVRVAELPRSRT